jgi:integrase
MKWSYSIGETPSVTVYEREVGGILYARAWDGEAKKVVRKSLGHRNKKRAMKYARDELTKLEMGIVPDAKVTLAEVLSLYETHRSPRKAESEQKSDARRAKMWVRVLGNIDPHSVTLSQWEAFIDARSSGAINAKGLAVKKEKRKAVRARTVEYDCVWLSLVFNWASKWRLPSGKYLMRENPVRGYEIPKERNPRRPVASQDRFEAIRAVSDRVLMEKRHRGKREAQRSYLSELLDIANGTGRRIKAICSLRFEDLRLERTQECPYGAIHWPAETDKMKRATTAPISKAVRAALDRIMRDRPGIGAVPLFPSPTDKERAMSRHLADAWLREAEKLAKVEPQRGGLWHPLRRKWATERKHLPDVDVAAAGGWASLDALKKSYQQTDEATMLRVVLGAGELREAK